MKAFSTSASFVSPSFKFIEPIKTVQLTTKFWIKWWNVLSETRFHVFVSVVENCFISITLCLPYHRLIQFGRNVKSYVIISQIVDKSGIKWNIKIFIKVFSPFLATNAWISLPSNKYDQIVFEIAFVVAIPLLSIWSVFNKNITNSWIRIHEFVIPQQPMI